LWLPCLLAAAPALAQSQAPATPTPPAPAPARSLEIAPFVSRGAGSSGVGAAVRWRLGGPSAIQFDAEYRRAPADSLRQPFANNGVNLNANFTYELTRAWRLRPYLLGGGGIEHYATPDTSRPWPEPRRQAGYSFVLNGGGGITVPIDERWGMRVEARWSDGWMLGAHETFHLFYGATFGLGTQR
jgi:hypothetical protein